MSDHLSPPVRTSPRLMELDRRAHALYVAGVKAEQQRKKTHNQAALARNAAAGKSRKFAKPF